jgi:hypothetical protein
MESIADTGVEKNPKESAREEEEEEDKRHLAARKKVEKE